MTLFVCSLCEATSAGTAVTRATRDLCSYCVASLARTGRAWCTRGRHVVAAVGNKPTWCAACRSAANKAYRTANHERELARVKAWKQAHHSQPRKRTSAPSHPDRRRAWYAATRDERLQRARAYRHAQAAANPNYWRERRQRAKVNAFRRLWGRNAT